MSVQLSERVIKLLCGDTFYERGEAYYKDGKVTLADQGPEASSFKAIVMGNHRYEVTIDIDLDGDVEAECSCLAFSTYDKYCQHVAAALLQIHHFQNEFDKPARIYPSLLHPEDRPYYDDDEADTTHLRNRYAAQAG